MMMFLATSDISYEKDDVFGIFFTREEANQAIRDNQCSGKVYELEVGKRYDAVDNFADFDYV